MQPVLKLTHQEQADNERQLLQLLQHTHHQATTHKPRHQLSNRSRRHQLD